MLEYLLLGIALAASPGPTNAETLRRGLREGFASALLLTVGAVAADTLYLLAVLWGLSPLLTHGPARTVLLSLGVCVLVYLGVQSMRNPEMRGEASRMRREGRGGALVAGFVINFFNPAAVITWLGILGTVSSSLLEHSNALVSIVAIPLGALAWGCALAAATHWGRRFLSERAIRGISYVTGALLIGYGIYFAYLAAQAFL